MTKLIEKWVDIKNYEGLYQISNFGIIKSLDRIISNGTQNRLIKGVIRKQGLNHKGYNLVGLCNSGKQTTHVVHLLVWDHFGEGNRNGMVITVDHIDNDKLNNRIDNLQLLSNRDNNEKGKKVDGKPTGVHRCGSKVKFYAYITVNKKSKFLGSFTNQEDASNAYQKAKSLL